MARLEGGRIRSASLIRGLACSLCLRRVVLVLGEAVWRAMIEDRKEREDEYIIGDARSEFT